MTLETPWKGGYLKTYENEDAQKSNDKNYSVNVFISISLYLHS